MRLLSESYTCTVEVNDLQVDIQMFLDRFLPKSSLFLKL